MENLKRKVLILSPQLPSNPNGGAKILQDRFKLLSGFFDLYLIARDSDTKNKNKSSLTYFKYIYVIKKVKIYNLVLFFYRYFLVSTFLLYKIILKEKIKIIQLEYFDNLLYSIILFPLRLIGIKIYYTAHDIQCLYYSKNSFKFKVTRFFENIFFRYFIDYIFVWGDDDFNEILSWNVKYIDKVKIIPPIILTDNHKKWSINKENNFVFMGSINHSPNRDSLNLLLTNLWPEINKILPDSKLYLILGKKNVSLNINDPSIINCGFVNDPIDILSMCNIFIAPIVSGTGIKIKIIESFSFGIPLISTSLGFKNFNRLNGKIVMVAHSTEDYISYIKFLINNRDRLLSISNYEKEFFNKNFSSSNINLYVNYYNNI